jgi:RNA polymerase sigma factor (sigma-70 family)
MTGRKRRSAGRTSSSKNRLMPKSRGVTTTIAKSVATRFGISRGDHRFSWALEMAARPKGVTFGEIMDKFGRSKYSEFKNNILDQLKINGHRVRREGEGRSMRVWLAHKNDREDNDLNHQESTVDLSGPREEVTRSFSKNISNSPPENRALLKDRAKDRSPDARIEDLLLSVRAVNCLKAMNVTFVRDLINLTENELLHQPNMGRKSVSEIKRKLKRLNLRLGMKLADSPTNKENATTNASKMLAFETSPELLVPVENLNFSIRTLNCLKVLRVTHVGDLVQLSEPELLRADNLGQVSLRNIKEVLNELGLSLGMELSVWPPNNLELLSPKATQRQSPNETVISNSPLNISNPISVADAIEKLSERERFVIKHRYNLFGFDYRTLEQLGSELNVTRERIRQLEQKGRKKLLKQNLFWHLESALEDCKKTILEKLFENSAFLSESQLEQKWRDLGAEEKFLIGIVHEGSRHPKAVTLKSWLFKNTSEVEFGWLDPAMDSSEFTIFLKLVTESRRDNLFPIPIGQLVHSLPRKEIAMVLAAVDAEPNLYRYRGYAFDNPPSVRRKRRAIAHRILTVELGRQIVDLSTLVKEYHLHAPHDMCSTRDLDIVMRDSPHLFLNIGNQAWYGLIDDETSQIQTTIRNGHSNLSANISDGDSEKDDEDIEQIQNGGIRSQISRYLEKNGPSRLVAITDAVIAENPNFSSSSVPVYLVTNSEFVRIAPGIYALPEHLAAFSNPTHVCRNLLNSRSCKDYVLSRRAQEPMTSFCGWTIGMEHAWADWCRESGEADLYESLLEISNPEAWPVSSGDQKFWLRQKSQFGNYRFNELRPKIIPERIPPTLIDLARASILGEFQGHLTWLSYNRSVLSTYTDKNAVYGLAVLTLSGILIGPRDWDGRFVAGPNIQEFNRVAVGELAMFGELAQSGPTANLVENWIGTPQSISWLSEEELETIWNKFSGPNSDQKYPRGSTNSASPANDFAELVKRKKRSRVLVSLNEE